MFKNLSIYKLGQWPKSFDAFEHDRFDAECALCTGSLALGGEA